MGQDREREAVVVNHRRQEGAMPTSSVAVGLCNFAFL
jgi:hypothetical protein